MKTIVPLVTRDSILNNTDANVTRERTLNVYPPQKKTYTAFCCVVFCQNTKWCSYSLDKKLDFCLCCVSSYFNEEESDLCFFFIEYLVVAVGWHSESHMYIFYTRRLFVVHITQCRNGSVEHVPLPNGTLLLRVHSAAEGTVVRCCEVFRIWKGTEHPEN